MRDKALETWQAEKDYNTRLCFCLLSPHISSSFLGLFRVYYHKAQTFCPKLPMPHHLPAMAACHTPRHPVHPVQLAGLPRLRRQANFTCQLYVEPDQDTSKQKQNPKNGPFFLSLSSIAPCDGPSGGPVSPAAVCTDVGFVALIYLTRMLSCCVQTGQTSNVSHLGSIHDCFRTKKKKWLEGRQAI